MENERSASGSGASKSPGWEAQPSSRRHRLWIFRAPYSFRFAAKGGRVVSRCRFQRDPKREPFERLSNRERHLLEHPLTYRKQTRAPRSNRELSTNQRRADFAVLIPPYGFLNASPRRTVRTSHLRAMPKKEAALTSHSPLATSHWSFLPGSASQAERDVTYSKQKTEEILPGATT
jgi:hypothetical protein